MNQPQANEYPTWAEKYIRLVDNDVLDLLEKQAQDFPDFISTLEEKADYSYAPGKWTVRELIGHIIDTERILIYRTMCFARAENIPLPGFDEDKYVLNAHFSDRSLLSFSEEFSLLRKSNLYLFKSLNEEDLGHIGNASGKDISVNALLYVIAGHIIHHTQIIKERYL